jgi:hypothetical protein
MSKVKELNELKNQIRAEKIRIAKEVMSELRAGSFDTNADDASEALEVTLGIIQGEIDYQEECENAASSWDGLWTSRDEARLQAMNCNLGLVISALKKAAEADFDKIPF